MMDTIFALIIILGIAYCWHFVFRYTLEEGLILSASTIVFLLTVSGYTVHSFYPGLNILKSLGCLGILCWILSFLILLLARKDKQLKMPKIQKRASETMLVSFPFLIFIGLIFSGLLLFRHDFIQHIDEFHEWGFLVKRMFEQDALPDAYTVRRLMFCCVTGIFHLFFQVAAGYSEQNMYLSSFVLIWIGVLLPFSGKKKKDWSKILIYLLIVYLSFYSLYRFGSKTINVDLPAVCWAAGLITWWSFASKKRKREWFLLIVGLIMVALMKPFVGPLLALSCVAIIIWEYLFLVKKLYKSKKQMMVTAVVLIILVLFACFVAKPKIIQFILIQYDSVDDFLQEAPIGIIVKSFIRAMVGYSIAPLSSLKITFFVISFATLLLWIVACDWTSSKEETVVHMVYFILWTIGYMCILLAAFIIIFPVAEAMTSSGIRRYMSVLVIFNLQFVLNYLIHKVTDIKKTKNLVMLLCIIALIFMRGVNDKFIPNNTSWAQEDVKYSSKIKKAKKIALDLENELGDNDRVYIINQKEKDEIALNVALYYMEEKVSNFLEYPWYFYEEGCMIRANTVVKGKDIHDIPEYLLTGNFNYVWIYKSNKYLQKNFKEMGLCNKAESNTIYKVVYDKKGNIKKLEKVKKYK